MNIAFRVDASVDIGIGHVMRCLTLADEFRIKGKDIFFICRELPGNLCDIIESKGYKAFRLPYDRVSERIYEKQCQYSSWLGVSWEKDAEETKKILLNEQNNWLIVDHYALDFRWEMQLRVCVHKIIVIDDLANRKHDCDILIDQNLHEKILVRYKGLVSQQCHELLGPTYALLRPEFKELRQTLIVRDGIIRRIFIFFGGSDTTNETAKVLKAILLLNKQNFIVDVVLGKNNPNYHNVQAQALKMINVTIHCQISNMAELINNADLCIGAGGITTWERCCLGVPSIVITVAENQNQAIRYLAKRKILCYLGSSDETSVDDIHRMLKKVLLKPELLRQYSLQSLGLVDGFGGSRCVDKILSLSN